MPRGLCPREALAWLLDITAYGANRKHTMSQDNTSAVLGFTSGANINERELPCLPRIAVPARWAVRGGDARRPDGVAARVPWTGPSATCSNSGTDGRHARGWRTSSRVNALSAPRRRLRTRRAFGGEVQLRPPPFRPLPRRGVGHEVSNGYLSPSMFQRFGPFTVAADSRTPESAGRSGSGTTQSGVRLRCIAPHGQMRALLAM